MITFTNYLLLSLLFSANIFAQNSGLYIPLNIKKAYDRGTRSYDGTPGTNYWVNSADYTIRAEFDPKTRILKGSETIRYYNNSTDTLEVLVIKLLQDFYKKNTARSWDQGDDFFTEGVNISSFNINGKPFNVNDDTYFSRESTNLTVQLTEHLLPQSTVTLNISWSFTHTLDKWTRQGTYDETSFYIAYWYPQIAVYDDIDGWDVHPYLGEHEQYNDQNTYDVSITVPGGFGVWATGMLQNPSEVLSIEGARRYNTAQSSSSKISIISGEEENPVIKTDAKRTWRYKAEQAPDFAMGISDHYLWDALTYNGVFISSVYKPLSYQDFASIPEFTVESVKFLEQEFPGVQFPYPAVTVWNGAGGMEFPMIINQGAYSSLTAALNVTTHEVAHMYFPFMMGINEEKYAWMDEGITQMVMIDIQARLAEENDEHAGNVWWTNRYGGTEYDFPQHIPTYQMRGRTYDLAAYFKPAVALQYLREAFGKEKYDAAFREFINRWKGKHPIPYDFFFSMNKLLGEDLNWYWNGWFQQPGYADLEIKEVQNTGTSTRVLVQKNGLIPVPIHILVRYSNESTKQHEENVLVWKDGVTEKLIEIPGGGDVESVHLGSFHAVDHVPENDTWRR